jgi:hypothetical protein
MSAQNTHRQQHESVSLHDLPSTGRRLLGVSFIISLKSNLCTALNTQNTTQYCYYLTHTKHDCTSAQCVVKCNISVTGYKQRAVYFPHPKQYQGQTKTPLSLSVCVKERHGELLRAGVMLTATMGDKLKQCFGSQ